MVPPPTIIMEGALMNTSSPAPLDMESIIKEKADTIPRIVAISTRSSLFELKPAVSNGMDSVFSKKKQITCHGKKMPNKARKKSESK